MLKIKPNPIRKNPILSKIGYLITTENHFLPLVSSPSQYSFLSTPIYKAIEIVPKKVKTNPVESK
jgi:hypothetical protein